MPLENTHQKMSKRTKEVRSLEVGLHVIYQISQFGLKIKDLPKKEGGNEQKNEWYFPRDFGKAL